MAIITLLNQKGGVGKSTTTFHLGGALARMGRKVLVVDNDPQSSLTQGILGTDAAIEIAAEQSLAAVYAGEPVGPADLIRATPFAGLHLLPNSEHATRFNLAEPHRLGWEEQTALVEFLRDAAPGYDVVLVDCPPNLYLATWAALAASDALIIPVQPEDYGIQGLASVERSINLVRAAINPNLAMLGVLVTMFGARKSVHQAYDAILRETYGDRVFATNIPDAIDFPEATMHHAPLAWHKPRSAAAKAVASLAAEVVDRLDRLAANPGAGQGEAA